MDGITQHFVQKRVDYATVTNNCKISVSYNNNKSFLLAHAIHLSRVDCNSTVFCLHLETQRCIIPRNIMCKMLEDLIGTE